MEVVFCEGGGGGGVGGWRIGVMGCGEGVNGGGGNCGGGDAAIADYLLWGELLVELSGLGGRRGVALAKALDVPAQSFQAHAISQCFDVCSPLAHLEHCGYGRAGDDAAKVAAGTTSAASTASATSAPTVPQTRRVPPRGEAYRLHLRIVADSTRPLA